MAESSSWPGSANSRGFHSLCLGFRVFAHLLALASHWRKRKRLSVATIAGGRSPKHELTVTVASPFVRSSRTRGGDRKAVPSAGAALALAGPRRRECGAVLQQDGVAEQRLGDVDDTVSEAARAHDGQATRGAADTRPATREHRGTRATARRMRQRTRRRLGLRRQRVHRCDRRPRNEAEHPRQPDQEMAPARARPETVPPTLPDGVLVPSARALPGRGDPVREDRLLLPGPGPSRQRV